MKSFFKRSGLVLLIAAARVGFSNVAESPAGPAAQRILFLGDSITYGGLYVEYFETFLRLHYPQWRGEALNLGLPSETVSGLSEEGHAGGAFPRPDLHERLDRVLAKTKPDLVIACYGMNDGIYLPLSDERFKQFQDGIHRLRAKAKAQGARVIHLTPPTYDPTVAKAAPGSNYNGVLAHYSEWLLSKRSEGWTVLDVHGPMTRYLEDRRKLNREFRLSEDGVHPGEMGHWLIAKPLIIHFGGAPSWATAESAEAMLKALPQGPQGLKLVQQQQRLLKDAWLRETGHMRPGMNQGSPLPQAVREATRIRRQLEELSSTAAEKRE